MASDMGYSFRLTAFVTPVVVMKSLQTFDGDCRNRAFGQCLRQTNESHAARERCSQRLSQFAHRYIGYKRQHRQKPPCHSLCTEVDVTMSKLKKEQCHNATGRPKVGANQSDVA